jgi:hypothetical protein
MAHGLNLAGQDRARYERVAEALYRVTELAYAVDEDGYANVDRVTWRLRIPAPWGSSGWKHYGLREWEGRVLNRMLRQHQGRRPRLFEYDRQCWYLNVADYPTFEAAQYWLRHEVRYSLWQQVRQALR